MLYKRMLNSLVIITIDPNTTSGDGLSALHVACRNSPDIDIIDLVKIIVDR